MSDTRILSAQEVEECRSGDRYVRDLYDSHEALRAKLAEVERRLVSIVDEWEKREASVCPEGMTFEQHIADIQQQLDVLKPGGMFAWKHRAESAEAALATVTQERDSLRDRLASWPAGVSGAATADAQDEALRAEQAESALAAQTARAERLEGALRAVDEAIVDEHDDTKACTKAQAIARAALTFALLLSQVRVRQATGEETDA
jgi:DNA repair exonuclease SbcCD ATPase subunit